MIPKKPIKQTIYNVSLLYNISTTCVDFLLVNLVDKTISHIITSTWIKDDVKQISLLAFLEHILAQTDVSHDYLSIYEIQAEFNGEFELILILPLVLKWYD